MDDILDDLARCAERCERAARVFDTEPMPSILRNLRDAASDVGRAWCGSWIGRHSYVYTKTLQPPKSGEEFNIEWGQGAPGVWHERTYSSVRDEILNRAGVVNFEVIEEAAQQALSAFDKSQQELMPILDAVLSVEDLPALRTIRERIEALPNQFSVEQIVRTKAPTTAFSRDAAAMAEFAQGAKPPRHIYFESHLTALQSSGKNAETMGKLARQAQTFLVTKYKMKGRTVAKTSGKVFIGHGRSEQWRILKDFIQDKLELPWDEFNRESTAGVATTERLATMLDDACFAFLVMTGEDQMADDTLRARENVVHEVGLFQGRLGFKRAIILLEDGCNEFSNVTGLGEIRFPKGNILAKTEAIRDVLKREEIIR